MSYVLNNDVLNEVCLYLTTKDLFRLQIVSEQFWQCTDYVLGSTRKLVIGGGAVTESCPQRSHIAAKNFFTCDCNQECLTFDRRFKLSKYLMFVETVSLVSQKSSRIETIVFKNCFVGREIFLVLSRHLAKLTCLTMKSCMVPQETDYYGNEYSSLAYLKHFAVDALYDSHMFSLHGIKHELIRQMKTLEALRVTAPTVYDLKEVLNSLFHTIKWLSVDINDDIRQIFLNQSVDFFRNGSVYHLKYLYIEDFSLTNPLLISIIGNLQLIGFGFSCRRLEWRSVVLLSESQKNLRHLRLYWTSFYQWPKDMSPDQMTSVTILELNDLFSKMESF